MKIKNGYIIKKMLGSYMIFSADDSEGRGKMHTLNDTGAFLWNAISEGLDRSALIDKLTEEYEVDSNTASKDVDAFIARLCELGILIK